MYSRNSQHRLLVRNAALSSRRLSSARTARSRDPLRPVSSLSRNLSLRGNRTTTVLPGRGGLNSLG